MKRGFTLIELSIVLVIIALIVGGVLVGRDLIQAAEIRSQISQIEKFQTSVNAFRNKYNCMPGDCAAGARFGFYTRGTFAGQGDGNGIIEGVKTDAAANNFGTCESLGETVVFWTDLSAANLIAESFNTARSDTGGAIVLADVPRYFPSAVLGKGIYVYAYSGGVDNTTYWASDGANYLGISEVTSVASWGGVYSNAALTPIQAYNIDRKMDDAMPQTGSVRARYLNFTVDLTPAWSGPSDTTATAASTSTCYDNGNVGGATQLYSTSLSGANRNCGISFKMQ